MCCPRKPVISLIFLLLQKSISNFKYVDFSIFQIFESDLTFLNRLFKRQILIFYNPLLCPKIPTEKEHQ